MLEFQADKYLHGEVQVGVIIYYQRLVNANQIISYLKNSKKALNGLGVNVGKASML